MTWYTIISTDKHGVTARGAATTEKSAIEKWIAAGGSYHDNPTITIKQF